MRSREYAFAALAVLSAVAGPMFAGVPSARAGDVGDDLHAAVKDGKFWLSSRYRYEYVDQEGLPKDARASTISTEVGFETGIVHGFRFGIEGEAVVEVGPDDFNNTINGNGQYPVVVDVQSAEVNQAYVESHHIPGVVIQGGRYLKNLDNMRYVGSVAWRQNDQTFDGANATITAVPGVTGFYGYIGNVNRIFSDRSPAGNLESDVHLFHAESDPLPFGTLTGYAYLMDIADAPGLSNASFGGFLTGKQALGGGLTFNYRFEYARQTDYGNQPTAYDVDYVHLAPGLTWMGLTTTLGYELLGSEAGAIAFQTPLATGHVFNGFADVFLNTPAAGLQDSYVDVRYKLANMPSDLAFLNGLLLIGQYHEFESDVGDVDYGSEIDFYSKLPLREGFYAEFKYANYQAKSFATDREKFIFGLGYAY
jgi:hypothetical protein